MWRLNYQLAMYLKVLIQYTMQGRQLRQCESQHLKEMEKGEGLRKGFFIARIDAFRLFHDFAVAAYNNLRSRSRLWLTIYVKNLMGHICLPTDWTILRYTLYKYTNPLRGCIRFDSQTISADTYFVMDSLPYQLIDKFGSYQ